MKRIQRYENENRAPATRSSAAKSGRVSRGVRVGGRAPDEPSRNQSLKPPKPGRLARVIGPAKSHQRWRTVNLLATTVGFALAVSKALLGLVLASPYLAFNALHGLFISASRLGPTAAYRESVATRRQGARRAHDAWMQELAAAKRTSACVIAASALYFLCGLGMVLGGWEMKVDYGTIGGITMATVAFVELGIAIAGLVSHAARNSPAVMALKTASLSTALISISLAQAALLAFASTVPTAIPNALGCMFMALLSLVVGIAAYWKFRKREASLRSAVFREGKIVNEQSDRKVGKASHRRGVRAYAKKLVR